jgi:polyhydroxybutyrate depolymerase
MLLITMATGLLTGHVPLMAHVTPAPSGVHGGVLRVGQLDRTFTVFVPHTVSPAPATVLALHAGSGGSGARLRGFIGRELDLLAEQHGFLVVYPDGIDGSWNDCRRGASYGAKRRNVDDVGFLRELPRHLADHFGADPDQVFTMGYSNGAHLAFRVALEAPDLVRAIVAFGANLPAPDALDCTESRQPVSVLIINGTSDHINPYKGGDVTLPDGTRLGRVRSAEDTFDYFSRLAGSPGKPERLIASAADSNPVAGVEVWRWQNPGRAEVCLHTVHGGGHTIPSPIAKFPAWLGRVERAFSGVSTAVRFFGFATRHQRPGC